MKMLKVTNKEYLLLTHSLKFCYHSCIIEMHKDRLSTKQSLKYRKNIHNMYNLLKKL